MDGGMSDQPDRIDPSTLYTGLQLKRILKGFVSLDTLREHGLTALPGAGYWGKSVIFAIDSVCGIVSPERGLGVSLEAHNEFFENSIGISDSRVHGGGKGSRAIVQSPRVGTVKRGGVHSPLSQSRKMGCQRDEFDRLTNQATD